MRSMYPLLLPLTHYSAPHLVLNIAEVLALELQPCAQREVWAPPVGILGACDPCPLPRDPWFPEDPASCLLNWGQDPGLQANQVLERGDLPMARGSCGCGEVQGPPQQVGDRTSFYGYLRRRREKTETCSPHLTHTWPVH